MDKVKYSLLKSGWMLYLGLENQNWLPRSTIDWNLKDEY